MKNAHSLYNLRRRNMVGVLTMVVIASRTSSNIYVLTEIGNEKCCLGKED
jgi:hypothetical protein